MGLLVTTALKLKDRMDPTLACFTWLSLTIFVLRCKVMLLFISYYCSYGGDPIPWCTVTGRKKISHLSDRKDQTRRPLAQATPHSSPSPNLTLPPANRRNKDGRPWLLPLLLVCLFVLLFCLESTEAKLLKCSRSISWRRDKEYELIIAVNIRAVVEVANTTNVTQIRRHLTAAHNTDSDDMCGKGVTIWNEIILTLLKYQKNVLTL